MRLNDERMFFMNKKAVVITVALLAFFVVGSVFAETLQCRDPKDGKITVTYMGDVVRTAYDGKSAQAFEVVVLLKDGTTQYITFRYPKVQNDQSRTQNERARGPIEKVTKCDFTSY
jgi:hypothetical protein